MFACRSIKYVKKLLSAMQVTMKNAHEAGRKRVFYLFNGMFGTVNIPEFAWFSTLHGDLCIEPSIVMADNSANISSAVISSVSRPSYTKDFGRVNNDHLFLCSNSFVFDEINSYESPDRNNRRSHLVKSWNNNDTRKFVFSKWKIFLIFGGAFRVVWSVGLLHIGHSVGKGSLTMQSLDSPTIAFFSLLLGLVIALFTAFKYFSNELGTLRREAELNIKSSIDTQDKQRQLLATQFTNAMNDLRLDLTRTNEKFQNLALEVVRKADMTSFETRITSILSQQESRFTLAVEKLDNARAQSIQHLETKIDRVIELRRNQQDNNRATGD